MEHYFNIGEEKNNYTHTSIQAEIKSEICAQTMQTTCGTTLATKATEADVSSSAR